MKKFGIYGDITNFKLNMASSDPFGISGPSDHVLADELPKLDNHLTREAYKCTYNIYIDTLYLYRYNDMEMKMNQCLLHPCMVDI